MKSDNKQTDIRCLPHSDAFILWEIVLSHVFVWQKMKESHNEPDTRTITVMRRMSLSVKMWFACNRVCKWNIKRCVEF